MDLLPNHTNVRKNQLLHVFSKIPLDMAFTESKRLLQNKIAVAK